MVDIETLGTKYNSVVTQIGAIYFDRTKGVLDDGICINISIDDCLNNGLVVDSGALKFWYENVPTWLTNTVSIGSAITTLNVYCKQATAIWSHATFDMPILANLCNAIGQKKLPFSFRNCRDIRTLIDLSKLKTDKEAKREGKTHNALDDCKYQVEYCVQAFRLLGIQ
jgi:hypothetical protein